MPHPYAGAIITHAGAALLAEAQRGISGVKLTNVAVGSGIYSEEEKTLSALRERTSLKAPKNYFPVVNVSRPSSNTVKARAYITNYSMDTRAALVSAGYNIREIALYARMSNASAASEVLYAIVLAADDGDYLPAYDEAGGEAQIVQDFLLTVDANTNVSIPAGNIPPVTDVILTDESTGKRYSLQVSGGEVVATEVGA